MEASMRAMLCVYAAVIAASACPGTASAYSSYPEIDETASWLSQRPVTVRCLTETETGLDINMVLWGASAYVETDWSTGGPKDYTVFEYGLCEKLHALYTQTWYGTFTLKGIACAVLALTHEAGHLRGWGWWKDEGKTNLWAVRHARYTALHLGANEHISILLRDRARVWCEEQPEEYNRYGCR